MNKHLTVLVAISIFACTLGVTATAQTMSAQRVVASIPFSFHVGSTKLPAGKYTVTVLNSASDRKILQLRSAGGRASAMTLTTTVNGNASDEAKLVFQRYGDQYFFSKVQMASDPTILAALKSSKERAQRQSQTLAAAGKKSIVVVIAE